MSNAFDIAIFVAIGAVFLALCAGVFTMLRGGRLAASYSNKLMRLRVVLQFVAIIVLVAAFYVKSQASG